MTQRFLSHSDLSALVAAQHAAGTTVIAPVAIAAPSERINFQPIASLEQATLAQRLPDSTIKQFFLPRTEVLLAYKQTKSGVELTEVPTVAKPQLILGATPCDVAALEIVDKVMNWDYQDELWNGRRAATTIVTLACTMGDASCFCTAVDLAPDSPRGSDAMLTPVDGGYLLETFSPKGEQLFRSLAVQPASEAACAEAAALRAKARVQVEQNLDKITPEFAIWLANNFDHPFWQTVALRCHGCGTCSAVCPTCHCFDIVDEHDDAQQGVRRRNWDTCQSRQFTIHASGHNPRANQNARFRQRILHKFSIYPSKFEEILCTGCGRCARACPGGMVLSEIVGQLKALSSAAAEGEGR